jgi:hypothetical protein
MKEKNALCLVLVLFFFFHTEHVKQIRRAEAGGRMGAGYQCLPSSRVQRETGTLLRIF